MPTLSGVTRDSTGALAQRLVRVYRRDTGAFIGQALSGSVTGAWSVPTSDTAEHFALMHDAVGDPYEAYRVLAMHMDGADSSTTFTDFEGNAITRGGDTIISTAQSKFGGASAYFDGTGDYLTVADFAGLTFGTGDFTIEAQVRFASIGTYRTIFSHINTWPSQAAIHFRIDVNGAISAIVGDGTDLYVASSANGVISANTWMHVAAERSGGDLILLVNDVIVATTAIGNISLYDVLTPAYIGAFNNGATRSYFLNGYLDEFIVTKGVAKYTGASAPPDAPFIDSLTAGTQNAIMFDKLTPV